MQACRDPFKGARTFGQQVFDRQDILPTDIWPTWHFTDMTFGRQDISPTWWNFFSKIMLTGYDSFVDHTKQKDKNKISCWESIFSLVNTGPNAELKTQSNCEGFGLKPNNDNLFFALYDERMRAPFVFTALCQTKGW